LRIVHQSGENISMEKSVRPRYFFRILPLVGLGLLATGCKKQQTATQSAAVPVPSAARTNQPAAPGLRDVDLDANAPPKLASIRTMDLKPFVESHLGELNPDLADLQTDCGGGGNPLQSLAPVLYGDLDGDGQEEAVLEGWSCLSGNGGADFRGVIKLMPTGKLAVLPIAPLPKTFKGRDPYTGLRGHMVVQIEHGKLVELLGIYADKDLNCCPENGERKFVYRWDGQRFVLDDIIDVPPEKNENQPAN
jgi:hypothetical protein